MMEKPSPERQAGGDKEEADGAAPMERFRSLARRLVNVPPDKVAEEQAKYDAEEDRKQRPRLKPN